MNRIRTNFLMRVVFALLLVIGVFGSSTHALLAVLSDHFDQIEWVMDMDMEEEEKENENEKEEKRDRYITNSLCSNYLTAYTAIFQKDRSFQILSHCEEILTPPPKPLSC